MPKYEPVTGYAIVSNGVMLPKYVRELMRESRESFISDMKAIEQYKNMGWEDWKKKGVRCIPVIVKDML